MRPPLIDFNQPARRVPDVSPAALHKRAERARKRAAGLKRIELWIDPRIERTVRAAIKRAFWS